MTLSGSAPKIIPTIGYGLNLKEKFVRKSLRDLGYTIINLYTGSESITRQDAAFLRDKTIDNSISDLRKIFDGKFDNLKPATQAALIDMHYQLGSNRFKGFKSMIKAIKTGDFKSAAWNVLNSIAIPRVGILSYGNRIRPTDFSKQTPKRASRKADAIETGLARDLLCSEQKEALEHLIKESTGDRIRIEDFINPALDNPRTELIIGGMRIAMPAPRNQIPLPHPRKPNQNSPRENSRSRSFGRWLNPYI